MYIKQYVSGGSEGKLVPAGKFLTKEPIVAEGGSGGDVSFEEERGRWPKKLRGREAGMMWSRERCTEPLCMQVPYGL